MKTKLECVLSSPKLFFGYAEHGKNMLSFWRRYYNAYVLTKIFIRTSFYLIDKNGKE
jgi:hypothetical protein